MAADRLAGVVRRRVAFGGTKSEHEAIVIDTGDAQLVLRRRGGNPFEIDPELEQLEGKTVEVQGTLAGTSFLVDGWTQAAG